MDEFEIDEYGNKYWYRDGEQHRDDGPAVEYADGRKEWFHKNKRHREDGPAIEWNDGCSIWYYKGIFVGMGGKPDPALWAKLTSKDAGGGPLRLNGCIVDLGGSKYWFKDDQYHREDGPAIEWPSGVKSWWFNGTQLSTGNRGFWMLWDRLTDKQRGNPNLLRYMPR